MVPSLCNIQSVTDLEVSALFASFPLNHRILQAQADFTITSDSELKTTDRRCSPQNDVGIARCASVSL